MVLASLRVWLASGLALVIVGAGPAWAGFEIVGTVPQPAPPVSSNPVAAPPPQDVVTGFGRDLPVEVVAAQVVPPEYSIAFTADVDRGRITSWTGGQDWRQVLDAAISPLGLVFVERGGEVQIAPARRRPDPIAPLASDIVSDGFARSEPIVEPGQAAMIDLAAGADEDTQLAELGPDAQLPAPRAAADPNALLAVVDPNAPPEVLADQLASVASSADPNGQAPLNDDMPELPVVQTATLHGGRAGHQPDAALYKENFGAEVGPSLRWSAHSGSTLKRTLEDWAVTAGWTIAWQSNLDYKLHAGADFDGDFLEAASSLLRTFGRAEPPVRATFYRGNQVVVVDIGLDSIN